MIQPQKLNSSDTMFWQLNTISNFKKLKKKKEKNINIQITYV